MNNIKSDDLRRRTKENLKILVKNKAINTNTADLFKIIEKKNKV